MVGYIRGYNGSNTMYRVIRDKELIKCLDNDGYELIYTDNRQIEFISTKIIIEISERDWEKIKLLNDYDVIIIYDSGIFCRLYSNQERDAVIVTTSRCNSNCVMCPTSENSRKNGSDVPIETLLQLIHYMPLYIDFLTITGGEPTLIGSEGFMLLMDAIQKKYPDTKLLLLTNGRSLGNSDFFNKFLQHKHNEIRVAIPIHSALPQKHDSITQVEGSFNQTVQGIKKLLKENIEVEIRIVVSNMNAEELDEIAKMIIQNMNSVKVVNFVALEMRGNCVMNHEKVIISYDEAFQATKSAIKRLIQEGLDVGLYNFPCCMVDREYWPITAQSIANYKAKYYPECESCQLKEICCGIFEASMKFYKPKVKPIYDVGVYV